MKPWAWLSVVVLAALHQDFWLWDDPSLVFGFLPVGLAYHAAYSVAASVLWWLVATRSWPETLSADETEPAS